MNKDQELFLYKRIFGICANDFGILVFIVILIAALNDLISDGLVIGLMVFFSILLIFTSFHIVKRTLKIEVDKNIFTFKLLFGQKLIFDTCEIKRIRLLYTRTNSTAYIIIHLKNGKRKFVGWIGEDIRDDEKLIKALKQYDLYLDVKLL